MKVWRHLIACGIAGALQGPSAAAVDDGAQSERNAQRLVEVNVSASAPPETVEANDNTRPTGMSTDGVVTIRLRAATGTWRPEGTDGPALTVDAFGAADGPLIVPGPLIRVKEGDRVDVSVRNDLAAPLRVHGLCARDGAPCAPIDVAPGDVRSVSFMSGAAGTYHYWATAIGAPMPFRELAGALVIDPRNGASTDDRIFVITEWSDLTVAQLREILSSDDSTATFVSMRPKVTFVINGLSWPATERLTYRRGERVRWRILNLSSQTHPMHLHGFYFTVSRLGDGQRDEPVAGGAGRQVVTQIVPSGGTLLLEWTPEREGNWLFHCHVMSHVSPNRRIGTEPASADARGGHGAHHDSAQHDASLGMAGMVLGITVLPSGNAAHASHRDARPPRKLTMVIQPTSGTPGKPAAGLTITEAGTPVTARVSSPGPLLLLRRDEPVDITVVNRLPEATSIHWHGLELDSFYDGVHGWSGVDRRLAPMIAPGASFVVRITPVRSGTFIYHTHLHDHRQLSSGVYGPLIVLEPGESYDPATDHLVVLGRRQVSEVSSILEDPDTAVMNGVRAPQLSWRAGVRNRVRLINITPDDILGVSLATRDAPVIWRPLTKDGAPVPETEAQALPAKVRIAVGETYDFEYDAPPTRHTLWLEVKTGGGKWMSQARVIVK
jgi:manganese oxidase